MLATILESIKLKIPENIQKEIKTLDWRKKQPPEAFLDPKGLKFPVKYKGEFRCDMIHAAIVFSAIFSKKGSSLKPPKYYQDMHAAAKALAVEQKCTNDKGEKIKLNENTEVDLIDVFEVYTLEAIQEMRVMLAEDDQ